LLFIMVVGFGGTMLVKGNHVTISPENEVRVAGWTVPLPASVKASPILGMVGTMLQGGNLAAQPASAAVRPGPPALPNVTSTVSTYNANAPRPAQTQGDPFNAANKALR
jgi:hypothetical protein